MNPFTPKEDSDGPFKPLVLFIILVALGAGAGKGDAATSFDHSQENKSND